MKKLLALFMALALCLSCVSALAQGEEAAALAVQTDIGITADRQTIQALASLADAEGSTANADLAAAVLDMLDNMTLSIVCGKTSNALYVWLGDTVILDGALSVQADGSVVITSSAIPSYALTLTAQEAQALLSQFTSGMQVTDIDVQALLGGYWEDAQTISAAAMQNAVASEDGTAVEIPLTTHQLADLWTLWRARLAQDQTLLGYMQQIIDKANAQKSAEQAVTLESLLAAFDQTIQQYQTAEDMQIATVGLYNEADGQSIEVDMIGTALISIHVADRGNAQSIAVDAIIAQNAGEDWQTIYDAINEGSNANGVIISLAADVMETQGEEAMEAMTVSLSLTQAGTDYVLSLDAQSTGVEGTESYQSAAALSVDIGMGTPLVTITANTAYVALPEMPATTDLTVISAMALNDADTSAALSADLSGYGLAGIITAAQAVMPEQVGVILNFIMAAQAPAVTETVPETAPAGT